MVRCFDCCQPSAFRGRGVLKLQSSGDLARDNWDKDPKSGLMTLLISRLAHWRTCVWWRSVRSPIGA